MSKRVLILSSTPRKGGNSQRLCEEFARGAREAGQQVELVHLREKTIGHCTGCYACKGGGVCTQKDDMAEALDKMVAADVIVMATPVYFYTMCGQMKTFIDRTVARYTEISHKEFYFIATAAVGSKAALERTFEEFRGFTTCLSRPKERGVICGSGAWEIGDIKGKPAMKQAYEAGKAV